MLMRINKGSRSIEEYHKEFKFIYDNLAAINKPVLDLDKVFQFARGLGNQYMDFRTTMLTKAPYPFFNQFVLALQGHKQTLYLHCEEEKAYVYLT